MALTRLSQFDTGTVLTEVAIEAEFDNIYNNALTLISPLTGTLALGGNRLTGAALGSETSPSFQFTGDTNTGIYSSGADLLDFVTAGVNAWRLNASGHLLAVTDNTYDIGASGATRPRNLYLAGDATIGDQFIVSGTGPHVIGGAVNAGVQALLTGAFTPASGTVTEGLSLRSTLTPAAAAGDMWGLRVTPTLVEFSSGVHPSLVGLYVQPTITAGVATVTDMSGIEIGAITAAAGTTRASGLKITGPSGGTDNYAVWVVSGGTRLGGLGAFAASDKYVIADANGNLHVSALGPTS